MIPSLEWVAFDTTGFQLRGQGPHLRVWLTPAGDGMGLHFIPLRPDIHADLESLESTRRICRSRASAAGAAIIEVETPTIQGCRCLLQVLKLPQQPRGMTYLGSLIIPFRDFSFVLKVQCPESGTTGIREAVILDEAMATGQVTIEEATHQIQGWMRDPYDSAVRDALQWNLSEARAHDARFPDHPLSRVRTVLAHLLSSLSLSGDAQVTPRYSFPS